MNLDQSRKTIEKIKESRVKKRGPDYVDKIPKTLIFSVRADIRDMATIVQGFDILRVIYTSKSSVIGLALSYFAESLAKSLLEDKQVDIRVKSTEEAENILRTNPRVDFGSLRISNINTLSTILQKVKEEEGFVPTSDIEDRAQELMKDIEGSEQQKEGEY